MEFGWLGWIFAKRKQITRLHSAFGNLINYFIILPFYTWPESSFLPKIFRPARPPTPTATFPLPLLKSCPKASTFQCRNFPERHSLCDSEGEREEEGACLTMETERTQMKLPVSSSNSPRTNKSPAMTKKGAFAAVSYMASAGNSFSFSKCCIGFLVFVISCKMILWSYAFVYALFGWSVNAGKEKGFATTDV